MPVPVPVPVALDLVEGVAGKGTFGTVLHVHDRKTDSKVALKVSALSHHGILRRVSSSDAHAGGPLCEKIYGGCQD